MSSDPPDGSSAQTTPSKSATITIRVIKSFEFRTSKNLILHQLDLETITMGDLRAKALEVIKTVSAFKPYLSIELDTLKLYTKAHGAKTSNLIINLDHDDWIFNDDSLTLAEAGIENETELSLFNKEAYQEYQANPKTHWD